jgi:pimeloyl-ACP methyl ester carboxylesterase
MKMKLTQRVLMGYYRTKFRTIGMVSPQKAASLAFDLFCTPLKSDKKPKIPHVFTKAEQISFKYKQITVRGFRWKAGPGAPKLLIAHGFSSYAYKFEKYVSLLHKNGFEVLAFDAPAHGSSDGERINALIYRDCMLQIEKKFGKLYAIIGHSLGGFAASLAMEKLPDQDSRKLILIAPATETKTALAQFHEMMKLSESVQLALVKMIEKIANEPLSYFSSVRAVNNTKTPTLWVHDTDDKICPYKDTAPIRSKSPKHLRFITTEELGHNKIYRDPKIVKTIVDFVTLGSTHHH